MNYFAKVLFLSLFLLEKLQGSYQEYFKLQELLYQGALKKGIAAVSPLDIDEHLAESILAYCPQEINDAITKIQEKNLSGHFLKNLILHGFAGTGKSSLAQAIAIKCKIPCLVFDASSIALKYQHSGEQGLDKIFNHVKELETNLNTPFIVIFDELDTLINQSAKQSENKLQVHFGKLLDKFKNSNIAVIGTMYTAEHLPMQMINRTLRVKIDLPNAMNREAILSYCVKIAENKYNMTYSKEFINALVQQTDGFSNSELEAVMVQINDLSKKDCEKSLEKEMRLVNDFKISYFHILGQIRDVPERKLEREIGTWKHTVRKGFNHSKLFPTIGLTLGICMFINQRLAMQQNQEKIDKQMSWKYLGQQALINGGVSLGVNLLPPGAVKFWHWIFPQTNEH